MSASDNTHRIPITRTCFRKLYEMSGSKQEYREWLASRSTALCVISSMEKDFWTVIGGGIKHRLRKLDELKIASRMNREQSIRGLTLIDQLTITPSLQILRLGDIRLAHPLALEQVKSQKYKYRIRCAALRSWSSRCRSNVISSSMIQELIPSTDPIIVTRDPLQQTLYVSASGNGRLAALKEVLSADHYVEVLAYVS